MRTHRPASDDVAHRRRSPQAQTPGPASLLGLQRTAGNAAATLAVQRMRDAPTSATLAPATTTQGAFGQRGAQKFWAECVRAAGPKVTSDSTRNPHRLLWNLTVNLSIGAPGPVGDPGVAFDADTEPDPDRPGERRIDEVSAHLKAVEDTFRAAQGKPIPDEVWTTMATELAAAVAAAGHDGGTLAAPRTEQWLYDAETKQNQKKGLRSFPGVADGAAIFAEARARQQEIEQFRDSKKVVATGAAAGTIGGAAATVELTITEADIYHICKRHTFEHFDFGDLKAINSFWPPEFTFDKVRSEVSALLPGIAQACLTEMSESAAPGEDLARWEGEDFTRGNQEVLGHTLFFIARIRDVDETGRLTGGVQTVAPDGKGAQAFLGSEIRQIGAQAAPPAQPAPAVISSPVTGVVSSVSGVVSPVTGVVKESFVESRGFDTATVDKKRAAGTFLNAGRKVGEAVKAGRVNDGDLVEVNGHRLRVEVNTDVLNSKSVKLRFP